MALGERVVRPMLAALRAPRRPIAGTIVGANHRAGHLLMNGASLPRPSRTERLDVAVLGAGISGLTAAWRLDSAGAGNLAVYDLEACAGGVSMFGTSPRSDFPWGAHYVPVPTGEFPALIALLEELRVITGRDSLGKPIYEPTHLCFAPQERLYVHGLWQPGLFPRVGALTTDLEELDRFRERMSRYRALRDEAGRPAFALPLEHSSRDPELLALDRISMRRWLDDQGFHSPRLRWFVEYACRDDYGATLETTSAWAGIFYFASRPVFDTPEEEEGQVLTWPEGNGYIVRGLVARLGPRVRPSSLVCRLEAGADGAELDVLDLSTQTMTRVQARHVVAALPKYVLKRLIAESPGRAGLEAFEYSPWVVANVFVDRVPEGRGAPPCWDNVFHDSESLGYIVATHQHLDAHPLESVLTWYMPVCRESPAAARTRMLATPWEEWKRIVVSDLERGHPGIASTIERIDVMLWGHAMVRPVPGFIWGRERREAARLSSGPVWPAHSDLSGIPLFEEALYRGVAAAEGVLGAMGIDSPSLLG